MAKLAEDKPLRVRAPEFCPECKSQQITSTRREGIIAVSLREGYGWIWECADCDYLWVPPGWEANIVYRPSPRIDRQA